QVLDSPFLCTARERAFRDVHVLVLQDRALSELKSSKGNVVGADCSIFRLQRAGPNALGFEKDVEGTLPRQVLLEASLKLFRGGNPLRAVDLDLCMGFGQCSVLRRQ